MSGFAILDSSDDEDNNTRTSRVRSSTKKTAPASTRTQNDDVPTRKIKGVKSQGRNKEQRGGQGKGTTRKREKDRHVSGTGRGKGQAKSGAAGNNNYGIDDEEAAARDVAAEADYDAEVDAEDAPEPEPETPTMTLAEFQAQQAAKRSGLLGAKKTTRKVNEGDIAGSVVLKKSTGSQDAISAGTYGKKKREKNRKVKRMVDIKVSVAAKPKPSFGDRSGDRRKPRGDGGDRGDRGGRGSARGGRRGAGSDRGDRRRGSGGNDRRGSGGNRGGRGGGRGGKPRGGGGSGNRGGGFNANDFPSLG